MSNKIEFSKVSDFLGLDNPAIVEKDYWIVELLKLLSNVKVDSHDIIFAGGTALAKSDIDIMRMSEDIDLKLIPRQCFVQLSRTQLLLCSKLG